MNKTPEEKRAVARTPASNYHSVEFFPGRHAFAYQFRLWDLSSQGLCFLVKKDSKILESLEVGAVFDMTFYGPRDATTPQSLKAEIRHITWKEEGRFKGHYLVGLAIIGNPLKDPSGSFTEKHEE